MRTNWPCNALPSVFQPQPEKTTLRNHSCATHAAAARNASRRLFTELNHGERCAGESSGRSDSVAAIGFKPCSAAYFSLRRRETAETPSTAFGGRGIRKPGRSCPQNQAQSAG